MKRTIAVALAVAVLSTWAVDAHALGLVKLGIKGGASLSRLNDEGAYQSALRTATGAQWDQKVRLGPVFGAFGQIDLGPTLSIRPEVLYMAKGEKYETQGETRTAQFDYLEVPLLLVYHLPTPAVKPGFYVGPAVSFEMSAEMSEGDDPIITETETMDISVIAGAEVLFMGRYTLEARVWSGFKDVAADENIKVKHQGAAVLFGLSFGLPGVP